MDLIQALLQLARQLPREEPFLQPGEEPEPSHTLAERGERIATERGGQPPAPQTSRPRDDPSGFRAQTVSSHNPLDDSDYMQEVRRYLDSVKRGKTTRKVDPNQPALSQKADDLRLLQRGQSPAGYGQSPPPRPSGDIELPPALKEWYERTFKPSGPRSEPAPTSDDPSWASTFRMHREPPPGFGQEFRQERPTTTPMGFGEYLNWLQTVKPTGRATPP